MDQLDFDIQAAIRVLANIVNRASRIQKGTAEGVPVVTVPVELLYEAKGVLQRFDLTEYHTNDLRQALLRLFS